MVSASPSAADSSQGSVHPVLNAVDLPEACSYLRASLRVPRRTQIRCHKGKVGRGTTFPKAELPCVLEGSEVQDGGATAMEDDETLEQERDQTWACSACTFVNADVMPVCEVCGRGRHDPRLDCAYSVATADVPERGDRKAWPSLPQAAEPSWDVVDVSSTVSSWLEVGSIEDMVGSIEDLEEEWTDVATGSPVAVAAPTVSTPAAVEAPPSWAALVAKRSGACAHEGAVAPRSPNPAPMWSRRTPPLAKNSTKTYRSEEVELEDAELSCLEERRLHGSRGCRIVRGR